MRYGYCTDIRFLDGNAASRTVFDAVAEAGYDYVELPFSALSVCGEISELKKILRGANLPCRACNLFFPSGLKLAGKEMDKAGIRAYLERMLPLAAEFGIETLVFGNGGARKIPPGETREAVWDSLRYIAEAMEKYAEAAGVFIAVEPLNTTETDMINSFTQAVELTRGLNCVAAMLDSYHVLMEGQDYTDALRYPERILHLHTAYSKQRLVPSLADNKREYAPFVKAVNQAGYDNKISVEGRLRGNADVKTEVKAALELLKYIFEGDAL